MGNLARSPPTKCHCDGYIKDTICGLNPLTNILYSFILACCVISLFLYVWYLLYWRKKHKEEQMFILLFALGVFIYAQIIILLKCTDIFFDLPKDVYHFFQNEETAVIDGVGVYVNVWIQNYLNYLHSDHPVPKCQIRFIRILQGLLFIVVVADVATTISFVFLHQFSQKVGAQNSNIYVKAVARGFIMLCALIVGISVIRSLSKITGPVFRRRVTERIILIVIGISLQLIPLLLEIGVMIYHDQWIQSQQEACRNEGIFFIFYIFSFELAHISLPFALIIYLILEAGFQSNTGGIYEKVRVDSQNG